MAKTSTDVKVWRGVGEGVAAAVGALVSTNRPEVVADGVADALGVATAPPQPDIEPASRAAAQAAARRR